MISMQNALSMQNARVIFDIQRCTKELTNYIGKGILGSMTEYSFEFLHSSYYFKIIVRFDIAFHEWITT